MTLHPRTVFVAWMYSLGVYHSLRAPFIYWQCLLANFCPRPVVALGRAQRLFVGGSAPAN
jgi:hypothetical protein